MHFVGRHSSAHVHVFQRQLHLPMLAHAPMFFCARSCILLVGIHLPMCMFSKGSCICPCWRTHPCFSARAHAFCWSAFICPCACFPKAAASAHAGARTHVFLRALMHFVGRHSFAHVHVFQRQ